MKRQAKKLTNNTNEKVLFVWFFFKAEVVESISDNGEFKRGVLLNRTKRDVYIDKRHNYTEYINSLYCQGVR